MSTEKTVLIRMSDADYRRLQAHLKDARRWPGLFMGVGGSLAGSADPEEWYPNERRQVEAYEARNDACRKALKDGKLSPRITERKTTVNLNADARTVVREAWQLLDELTKRGRMFSFKSIPVQAQWALVELLTESRGPGFAKNRDKTATAAASMTGGAS